MTKKRIVLIDYLKAVCVIFVIITHGDFLNDSMLDKDGLFYLLCVNKAVPVFMFLSGYVYALSAKGSLKELYSKKRIAPKLLRLFIPTVIAYAVYLLVTRTFSPAEILYRFAIGNWGRGSYYFHIMVQFVLLAPCIYTVISRFSAWGVAALGGINLLYELVWTLTKPSDGLYRVLFFRYLLITAFGMYFAHKKPKKTNIVVIIAMLAAGLVYILLPYLTDYTYKIFTVSPWNRSGMMSAFYVAALLYMVFKLFEKCQVKGLIGNGIARVGQASYHIMYTQMLYFVVRPAFDIHIFPVTELPLFVQFLADIVVSVASGLVFCVLDEKVFGKFYRTK